MFKYHGDDLMERQGLKTEDKKKKKKTNKKWHEFSSVQSLSRVRVLVT